jgi:rhamnose transport system permease protein
VRWLQRHVRPEQIRELSLLFLILVAIVVFGSLIDGYYTSRTFNRIASSVAIITVVAVGQTLVVLTRNIDLSVGSIVGCTAYFVGTQIAAHPELSPAIAVLIAVALGAAMGVINGVIVAWGRVPSIIVTLGTLAIYRGLLIDYSGAKTVTTASLPAWVVELPRLTLFTIGGLEIRAMVALAFVIVCAAHFAIRYLNFGRRFYGIGSNPDAAELVGLPARRIVFAAFLASGALSGLAGFMTLARFGTITVENAIGLELQVVAAVVVGGVNIFGGSGTVIGAMLGAVIIGTLEQSLFRLQISQFWLDALLGLLILLAVASDTLILRRLRALWAHTELRLVAEASPEAGERRVAGSDAQARASAGSVLKGG